jgi:plastocyanin
MRLRPILSLLLATTVIALTALVYACSKSSNKGTNVVQVVEPFESGNMSNSGPTSVFVHTFNTAGSFSYRCRFHGSMTGTISVASAGADSFTLSIMNLAFASPPGALKVGGRVRWENNETNVITHSVTRP